jgi:hypothetical protein
VRYALDLVRSRRGPNQTPARDGSSRGVGHDGMGCMMAALPPHWLLPAMPEMNYNEIMK